MPKIEVCRIVANWNAKHEEDRWWEVRLITSQGEKVIKQEKYRDERYRSDLFAFGAGILNDMFGSARKDFDDRKKSRDLEDSAHAKLIAEMIQDGWEPTSSDQLGRINMMKRTESE